MLVLPTLFDTSIPCQVNTAVLLWRLPLPASSQPLPAPDPRSLCTSYVASRYPLVTDAGTRKYLLGVIQLKA